MLRVGRPTPIVLAGLVPVLFNGFGGVVIVSEEDGVLVGEVLTTAGGVVGPTLGGGAPDDGRAVFTAGALIATAHASI